VAIILSCRDVTREKIRALEPCADFLEYQADVRNAIVSKDGVSDTLNQVKRGRGALGRESLSIGSYRVVADKTRVTRE
jgi:hypothetical protein